MRPLFVCGYCRVHAQACHHIRLRQEIQLRSLWCEANWQRALPVAAQECAALLVHAPTIHIWVLPAARPSVPTYSAETRDSAPLIMVRSELAAGTARRSTGVCCSFGSSSHIPHTQSPITNRRDSNQCRRICSDGALLYRLSALPTGGSALGRAAVTAKQRLSELYYIYIDIIFACWHRMGKPHSQQALLYRNTKLKLSCSNIIQQ